LETCVSYIRIAYLRDDTCATCERIRKEISDTVTEPDKIAAAEKLRNHNLGAVKEMGLYNHIFSYCPLLFFELVYLDDVTLTVWQKWIWIDLIVELQCTWTIYFISLELLLIFMLFNVFVYAAICKHFMDKQFFCI